MSGSTISQGFAYNRGQFQQIIDDTLAIAKALGATDAAAEVSEGAGLSVSVRKGELENVERNRDKTVGITVYAGQRRGNASTSDFSKAALEQTVRAAFDIARFTAEDPAAGLPEADELAPPEVTALDLDLFHPWALDADGAADLARRCEDAAFATSPKISNSEGGEGCVLTAAGQLGGRVGVQGPGVEQVQVHRRHCRAGQLVGIGQAGGRVLGGEAGDVKRRTHGLLQRGLGEITGAGIAPALAGIDRDADCFVAVALDVFQLALAHRDRQAGALAHLGRSIGGTQGLGDGQRVVDDLLELLAVIGKTLGNR